MRDYNFFEPYILPPKKTNYERLTWLALSGILLILLFMHFFHLNDRINEELYKVDEINEKLASKIVLDDVKALNDIEASMFNLTYASNKLKVLDISTQLMTVYDIKLYKEIVRRVPENIFINNMNFSASTIQITGYGLTVDDIALFSHQLSNLYMIKDVFVSSIEKSEGGFAYTINVKL